MKAEFDNLLGRIRLIVLIDAAENAGLAPISILSLHTFAYLSNVLSPIWNLSPLEGKILKRRGGPFYPVLQQDLDRLVGIGVVLISQVAHVIDEDKQWRLEGSYCLHRKFADGILAELKRYEKERYLITFIQELAFALSALADSELIKASKEDASYSDSIVDFGNVLDFAEWKDLNYSANAALYFKNLIPGGLRASQGEMLHLYIRHLHKRLHNEH